MSIPANFPRNNRISWSKFVPDMITVLLYFLFLDPLMKWQLQHLGISCILLMLLNIAAAGIGCYTFFSGYADMEALTKYRNSLSKFESAALGLSAFISCFACLWWLAPFAGAKAMGVKETGAILGMTAYFITFIGVVASSINSKKHLSSKANVFVNLSNIIITPLFFFFSYAFLSVTLKYWQPSWIAAPYLAILCLTIFYLPLRFFLLLRPPFHKLEYVSFVLSFGFLLWQLFVSM